MVADKQKAKHAKEKNEYGLKSGSEVSQNPKHVKEKVKAPKEPQEELKIEKESQGKIENQEEQTILKDESLEDFEDGKCSESLKEAESLKEPGSLKGYEDFNEVEDLKKFKEQSKENESGQFQETKREVESQVAEMETETESKLKAENGVDVQSNLSEKRKKVNKKKMIIIIVIVVSLAFSLTSVLMIQINAGRFPGLLKLDNELKSEHENVKFVGNFFRKNQAIVYYPDVDDPEMERQFKLAAIQVLYGLGKVDKDTKVDYTAITYYNDKYVGIEYGTIPKRNAFFYTVSGKRITNDVLDDFLREYIKNSARGAAKEDEVLKEYAHTIEFAEATETASPPFDFAIVGNNLRIMYEEYYEGLGLEFSLPLDELVSHIDLDLGIEQKNPNLKAKAPYRYVDPTKPMIALTFDDGPLKENTMPILEELYRCDGVATFYVLGLRVQDTDEHQTIIDMINMGNEVGSHSITHEELTYLARIEKDEELHKELYTVQEDVKNITGGYEVKTYRPPYGMVNAKVLKAANFPFVNWTVDTLDWQVKDSQKIYEYVMANAKDGDIVLLHDIHKESSDAAVRFIRDLKEKGFQLVTVSQLMEAKGVQMQPHRLYGW